MRKESLVICLLTAVNLIYLNACKSKKPVVDKVDKKEVEVVQKTDSSKDLYKQIVRSKNASQYLYFSSTADYNDGKQQAELSVELTAEYGKYTYMNVKAMGIINVARVLIKEDSVRILDMINRTYISASYNYLTRFTSAPLTFAQVQNMVWANAAFDPETGKSRVDSLGELLKIISKLNATVQTATYSNALKTQSVVFTEQDKKREMQVKFEDMKDEGGLLYPRRIVIHIQGEKNMDCKFTIGNFATVIKKEPQFVVPKTYKVQIY